MSSIRAGEDIPDPDQMDLYQSIGDLENRRQSLFGENWISEEGADEE
ncbi:hypothetical protein Halru_0046 [Halovivax ruber XH-70]|uniref:Uncharacterized protein n=2 Tax=Halovivax ruber TaxID=387341 RepID=L0I597_HALRX|nr:hypothetical protein Halru_0046 [Halovivax ruber XH-70]